MPTLARLARWTVCAAIASLLFAASPAEARLRLPGLIAEHMVLQRDVEAPLWGWAEPGEVVSVAIADQKHEAKADPGGRWLVRLKPMPAGGPHELVIRGQDQQAIRIADVLVGEVWLCAGQSNMAMTVSRAANAEEEIAEADHPQIRMFTVPRRAAAEPQQTVEGSWRPASPETVGGFSATAYYFGRKLHEELKVPIGLINASVGGTAIEAWTSLEAQEAVESLQPVLEAWKDQPARDESNPRAAQRANNRPAALYNGMIAPLVPYAIRGAIWYQGERNSRTLSHLYGEQLETLIRDWRRRWGQGDFSFYVVQLPNFTQRQLKPVEENGWVLVRQGAMLAVGEVPNAAVAVTTDIGEAGDIHPKNKQDVGERLALLALANDYGKDIPYSGPVFKSLSQSDGKVMIRFDHAEGLRTREGRMLSGFAMRDSNGPWGWADAKIVGDTVELTHPLIKDPVEVSYNWAANPVGNLVNKAGLPAAPFRVKVSDDEP